MSKFITFHAVLIAVVVLSLAPGLADDPKLVKATNLTVNTKADEDDPFLGTKELTLWYSSNAGGKFDIMMARRKTNRSPWGKGEVPDSYMQSPLDDRGPCLTRDDDYPQYLYYATRKDKDAKNFDLYVSVKQGEKKVFTEPTPVQATNSDADEMYPWLTASGKQLYFSRKTKDGWRVYLCKRGSTDGAQGFEEPVLIEELPPDFHHVTLTRDGKTMYLQGPLAGGRTGLFVSMKANKVWSKPEPLTMLNHPQARKGDRSPSLSANGQLLYFASDRPGGKGGFDLWAVPTLELRVRK